MVFFTLPLFIFLTILMGNNGAEVPFILGFILAMFSIGFLCILQSVIRTKFFDGVRFFFHILYLMVKYFFIFVKLLSVVLIFNDKKRQKFIERINHFLSSQIFNNFNQNIYSRGFLIAEKIYFGFNNIQIAALIFTFGILPTLPFTCQIGALIAASISLIISAVYANIALFNLYKSDRTRATGYRFVHTKIEIEDIFINLILNILIVFMFIILLLSYQNQMMFNVDKNNWLISDISFWAGWWMYLIWFFGFAMCSAIFFRLPYLAIYEEEKFSAEFENQPGRW